ncbi:hypothetical protein VNI00_000071 [Paramarasmius palmivorus]|uniref:Uncharacterized protein n=1 Tax=Paramarasmius palmivorus TaxID=297713 RepID=A0AAW0EDQ5_9AGAR
MQDLVSGQMRQDVKSVVIQRCTSAYESIVHRFIRPSSVLKWRTLQHYTCALVIGTTAFQAFTREVGGAPFQVGIPLRYETEVVAFFEEEDYRIVNAGTTEATKPTVSTSSDTDVVAKVIRMVRDDGRVVELVVTKTHALDLVLNTSCTMMMCFVSSSEMCMLYPELTLRYCTAIDSTQQNKRNVKTRSHYFSSTKITFNPDFTIFDPLQYPRDLTVLPHQVGDEHTLAIPLRPFDVPEFLTPGHRSMLRAHSWQLVFPGNGIPFVHVEFLKAPCLFQTYLVAPSLYSILKSRPPREVNLPLQNVNPSCFAVDPFLDKNYLPLFTLTHKELHGLRLELWSLVNTLDCGLKTSRTEEFFKSLQVFPPAAVAYSAFLSLSKITAVRKGDAKIQSTIVRCQLDSDNSGPPMGVQFIVTMPPADSCSPTVKLTESEARALYALGSEIIFRKYITLSNTSQR